MNNKFNSREYIEILMKELVFEFDKAAMGTTPVLIGSGRENAIRKKLEMILPSGVGVGTGCVIDTKDTTSKQTDIILYEKHFCPVFSINETPESTYYPCEGVIAVGEVKSTLSSSNFDDAFEKIKSVKIAQRRVNDNLSFRKYNSKLQIRGAESERYSQQENFYDQIYGFILCGEIKFKMDTLLEKIVDKSNSTDAYLLPNIIVSLKDGIIVYIDDKERKICNDRKNATGIQYIHTDNTQYLISVLCDVIRRGRSQVIPLEKYITVSESFSTSDGLHKDL